MLPGEAEIAPGFKDSHPRQHRHRAVLVASRDEQSDGWVSSHAVLLAKEYTFAAEVRA